MTCARLELLPDRAHAVLALDDSIRIHFGQYLTEVFP